MQPQQKSFAEVATIGIDIGKTTFHLIGQDRRGSIVMRAKVSRSQLFQRLANIPLCIIGMEPCSGTFWKPLPKSWSATGGTPNMPCGRACTAAVVTKPPFGETPKPVMPGSPVG